MKFVVDRIEKNIVICQNLNNEEIYEFKLESMPEDVEEGSVLKFNHNKFQIDMKEDNKRKKEIEKRMKKLKNEE